ncbi:MAG: xanthine dehydrogenase accessory protein XdhC [Rhizobiales bacterium]|nr:xanthine dehydrogenase accessory protein XdhC [Hyphomicrobiales bacterium]MBO6699798.1 xanthine dehydrogenase accessory protein XdhC [Hyphomicrobiales bacterium]MBO6737336.1 xanthine dehydrogenase accessory protein XdhC [Hyphomicrobiales bacterium]MBO6911590.1 xanthine dehydrogenase accessory protein XdhC [Hyphomicrobiales bacterium]MBO6954988.1 xanthine dehydrogenase accessory protein XdhC [Hyphomicrobiales bacterium]
MLDTSDPHAIGRFVQAAPAILVTVDDAKGSTPRIQGTQMLVSATAVLGTIGGGQLEYMAIDAARAMLKSGEPSRRLTIPLGPEIGQCCGGRVMLLLSKCDAQTAEDLTSNVKVAKEKQPSVYIFGAGHVGRALAHALVPLPVNSLLIDSREDELALADPAIDQDLTPLPETHIRAAAPGSAFVMLTHDHALDFLLTREALAREQSAQDVAYVGMIGSKTKRATFARWLEQETGSLDGMDRLTMPIGASKLNDKRPAVIAAMVAAELIEAVGTFQAVRHDAQPVSA